MDSINFFFHIFVTKFLINLYLEKCWVYLKCIGNLRLIIKESFLNVNSHFFIFI